MIRELTQNLDIISQLENEPNDEGGLSAIELKAKFDESGNKIKSYINETLIPDVTSSINEEVNAAMLTSGNMPKGGVTGQVIVKKSDEDYDLVFSDFPANADVLNTPRGILTDLSSAEAAEFDGTADITPGITGVLPVANGGTGAPGGESAGAALGRGIATCSTAAATAAKVAVLDGFARSRGAIVGVEFTYANTAANPTLNVNSTGAAAIIDGVTGVAVSKDKMAGKSHFFQFNGTSWVLINPTEWKYVSGAATGFPASGVGTVTVNLGFTPSAVILQIYNNYSYYTATAAPLALNNPVQGYWCNSTISSYAQVTVTATATGFTVHGQTGDASATLRYIAFA